MQNFYDANRDRIEDVRFVSDQQRGLHLSGEPRSGLDPRSLHLQPAVLDPHSPPAIVSPAIGDTAEVLLVQNFDLEVLSTHRHSFGGGSREQDKQEAEGTRHGHSRVNVPPPAC